MSALLATAASADIIPQECTTQPVATYIGLGSTGCTEGAMTFYNISGPTLPGVLITPTGNGLDFVGEMDGSNHATQISFSVRVPYGWLISGFYTAEITADIPGDPVNGEEWGIDSAAFGYAADGSLVYHQIDFLNAGTYFGPCFGCVVISYFEPGAPTVEAPVTELDFQTETYLAGTGAPVVRSFEITGFVATAPEPSSVVLLITILVCVSLAVRRSLAETTNH